MAKLTAKQRKNIPSSEFALKNRRFPINDKNHARAAIMLSNKGTTPKEAATVRRKAKAILEKKKGGLMSKLQSGGRSPAITKYKTRGNKRIKTEKRKDSEGIQKSRYTQKTLPSGIKKYTSKEIDKRPGIVTFKDKEKQTEYPNDINVYKVKEIMKSPKTGRTVKKREYATKSRKLGGLMSKLRGGGQGYLDKIDESVSASLKEPLMKLKKGGKSKMMNGGIGVSGYSDELKKGGQGYNAKEDESLGMRTGKESTKKQSMKARRDDSYGKFGKRSKLRKGGQGYYDKEDESLAMRFGKGKGTAKERDMSYGDYGKRGLDWTERGKKGFKKGGKGYQKGGLINQLKNYRTTGNIGGVEPMSDVPTKKENRRAIKSNKKEIKKNFKKLAKSGGYKGLNPKLKTK